MKFITLIKKSSVSQKYINHYGVFPKFMFIPNFPKFLFFLKLVFSWFSEISALFPCHPLYLTNIQYILRSKNLSWLPRSNLTSRNYIKYNNIKYNIIYDSFKKMYPVQI